MKVSELIEELQKFPKDADVVHVFGSVVSEVESLDVYISKDGVVMIGDEHRKDFESGKLKVRGLY